MGRIISQHSFLNNRYLRSLPHLKHLTEPIAAVLIIEDSVVISWLHALEQDGGVCQWTMFLTWQAGSLDRRQEVPKDVAPDSYALLQKQNKVQNDQKSTIS